MKELTGRVAAVTGAGSGIGRALSIELAVRGCHLAISDLDDVSLAETVAMSEGFGVKVTSTVVDVSDRDAVTGWADEVVDRHGRVNLVVNNAGVALAAPIDEMSIEDFEWLMDVNFWGVIYGTKAFLPHLKAAGEGHVVNVSSIFGLVSIPSQSAYNAAKFGVRGFTDALRIELDMEDCGVSATTVHPGGIKTNIARSARVAASLLERDGPDAHEDFDKVAMTSPSKAARQILRAVERDRRRALIGPDAVVVDGLSRLPAVISQRMIGGAANRRSRPLSNPERSERG